MFLRDVARAQKEEDFSDELAGYISGSVLETGAETTASEIISCKYLIQPLGTDFD